MAKAKPLLIVESPAKAKTIEKFLGRRYHVEASMGHVRDLPKSQLGISVDNGFEPKYITIRGKGPVVKKLRDQAAKASKVYLATDPDREGEAISWHLAHLLKLKEDEPVRVVFNEITKEAVERAVKEPRNIDNTLVDAQQARRLLDRLVGYSLSPLLWRKVRKGLSAGRVQSVAVKLICDREAEIEAFIPEEYWSITADLSTQAEKRLIFSAKYHGSAEEKKELKNEDSVNRILADIHDAQYVVTRVEKKERKRNPALAFTTSTLQQEASRKLGFNVRKTMRISQQLYEGLAIKGEGNVGLITYIRTDSTRLSDTAVNEAQEYIKERFGVKYSTPRKGGKAKEGAQDAHEAIRPSRALRTPDQIKGDLSRDQYRLYKLIWERFIASQMSPAILDTVSVDITANGHVFRASGSTIKFPGFRKVYIEGRDDGVDEDKENILPDLEKGQVLALHQITPKQHFTQPPARYTEATLVKELEEKGIGRPSTYAPIIDTIIQRGYVAFVDKKLEPTELGLVVNEMLEEHFPKIVDVRFTAELEKKLDKIEEGQSEWKRILEDFYGPFAEDLVQADKVIEEVDLADEVTDEVCEKCGKPMVIKHGRFGPFLACSGFPDCRNTRPMLEKVGVPCPKCNGEIVERRSKKGRKFFGCSNYPECDFVSWDKPTEKKCPICESSMVEKYGKRTGRYLNCSNEACDHTEKGKSDE